MSAPVGCSTLLVASGCKASEHRGLGGAGREVDEP
jgi:hypothetical protein